jgi:hypothetical protein
MGHLVDLETRPTHRRKTLDATNNRVLKSPLRGHTLLPKLGESGDRQLAQPKREGPGAEKS